MFKLKSNIVFKRENNTTGYLFSLGDDSSNLLRLTHLSADLAERLANGEKLSEIIAEILSQYDVSEDVLKKDLAQLKEELSSLQFIED